MLTPAEIEEIEELCKHALTPDGCLGTSQVKMICTELLRHLQAGHSEEATRIIEPRGCPVPGACQCMATAPPSDAGVTVTRGSPRHSVEAIRAFHAKVLDSCAYCDLAPTDSEIMVGQMLLHYDLLAQRSAKVDDSEYRRLALAFATCCEQLEVHVSKHAVGPGSKREGELIRGALNHLVAEAKALLLPPSPSTEKE